MDIFRFITAGNIDDGKSTLTGRLLHDTQSLNRDIISSVSNEDEVNLAYIADGLRAERTQGITRQAVADLYWNHRINRILALSART